jgi:4'-phosphopantetheinyl transferase EntD
MGDASGENLRLPNWPKFNLGALIHDSTQPYASVMSNTYLLALGMDRVTRNGANGGCEEHNY